MFNLNKLGALKGSGKYRIIQSDGWLYVFPANADFDFLLANKHSIRWDHDAVLTVDDEGYCCKSRFGQSSGNPRWS